MFWFVVTARMVPVLMAYCSAGRPNASQPDRMQHVEPLHPLVAREDVGGRVPLRMPHMQARAARIGKHVQHVEFRPARSVSSLRKVLFSSQYCCHFGSISDAGGCTHLPVVSQRAAGRKRAGNIHANHEKQTHWIKGQDGFRGKTVIVTGGANGIGQAIAIAFAAGDARVVIADIDETGGNGPGAFAQRCGRGGQGGVRTIHPDRCLRSGFHPPDDSPCRIRIRQRHHRHPDQQCRYFRNSSRSTSCVWTNGTRC
jgi:hypothetical protein